MRSFAFVLLFLVTVTQTVRADVIISEVYSAGSGNTTYTADWFELTNRGATTIDITGWRMHDSSASFGTSAALEEVTSIGAGQSVVFMESSLANFAGRVLSSNQAWFGTNTSTVIFGRYSGSGVGLSTGGDGVTVFDSLAVVQASVSFGAATTGFTFDNAAGLTGPISQLSRPNWCHPPIDSAAIPSNRALGLKYRQSGASVDVSAVETEGNLSAPQCNNAESGWKDSIVRRRPQPQACLELVLH